MSECVCSNLLGLSMHLCIKITFVSKHHKNVKQKNTENSKSSTNFMNSVGMCSSLFYNTGTCILEVFLFATFKYVYISR